MEIGEYRVESKLGEGGMASVYAAIQPTIRKRVAIKVISRVLSSNAIIVERFVQEARAVNIIRHPNIVDVFAFGALPDGRSYMVMEHLTGESLAARLRRGVMSVAEVAALGLQICDGLGAVHEQGIAHRDLKPENIFLLPMRNNRFMVKLLDFGVAKLTGDRQPRGAGLTSAGAIIGTPNYMAPEQARGAMVDQRADVYSLGVTLYESYLGRLPFEADDPITMLYHHMNTEAERPSAVRPEIPPDFEQLLLSMLEKDPEARPPLPVIEEQLAGLRGMSTVRVGFDSGPMEVVREPSQPIRLPVAAEPAARRTKGRGAATWMAVAVGALAVLGAAISFVVLRRAPAAPPPAAAVRMAPIAAPPREVAPVKEAPPAPATTAKVTVRRKVAAPAPRPAATPTASPAKPAKGDQDYLVDPFRGSK
jgi:serine/threonine-protein kinase